MVLLRHLRPSLIKDYCRWTQIGFARLCHKLAQCCSRTLLQGTHEFTWDRVDSRQPSTEAPFIKLLSSTGTTDTGPVVCSRPIQTEDQDWRRKQSLTPAIPVKMRRAHSTEIAAALKIEGSRSLIFDSHRRLRFVRFVR